MAGKTIAVALIMLLLGAGGAYFYLDQQNQANTAALAKRATDAEAQAKTLSTRLTALDSQVQQLDVKSKTLETQLAAAQAQVKTVQAQVTDLTAKNTALTTSVSTVQTQLDSSKAEVTKLTADLAAVNKQLDAAKLQAAQAKTEYDSLNTKYQALIGKTVIGDPATGMIRKSYVWSYKNDRYTMSVDVPQSLYDQYSRYPRIASGDFAAYVAHPADDALVRQVADQLTALAAARGLKGQEPAELAISFVQRLIYTYDNVTKSVDDYPRFPVETLVDDGGDCEDSAILMASILREMGRDMAFIVFPGHVALGVVFPSRSGTYYNYQGKTYYYVETTGESSPIGKMPDLVLGASATLQLVQPTAIFTYKWSSRYVGDKIEFRYTAFNNGTAAAIGYKLEVGFDAGGNTWYNPSSATVASISPSSSVTGTIMLTPPANKYTRLRIELSDPNGKVIEVRNGPYFNT